MSRLRLMVAACVVLTVQTATGCIGDGGADLVPDGGGSSASVPASLDDGRPQAGSWVDSPIELPLTRYRQVLVQAEKWYEAVQYEEWAPAYARHEEFIAKCMHEAGFEYYPQKLQPPENAEADDEWGTLELPELAPSRSDVEQYGYGVFQFDLGGSVSDDGKTEDENVSRNIEYVRSLSPEASRQYSFSYGGVYSPDGGRSYEESGEPHCVGKAEEALGGPWQDAVAEDDSWFAEVSSEISRISNFVAEPGGETLVSGELRTNPAQTALNRQWFECMRKAGLLGDVSPDQLEVGSATWLAFNRAFGLSDEGEIVDPDAPPSARVEPDAEVAIGLATADFDCRAETDYVMRFAQIQADVERRFIDSHEAQLDRLMATWEQKKK